MSAERVWRNISRSSIQAAHDGHPVTVVRPLTLTEADMNDVGPMFLVRCDMDGREFHAFEDELSLP